MICETCALNRLHTCPWPGLRVDVWLCGYYDSEEVPMAAIHDMARELHAIAAMACEATGEERGMRSALECVEAMGNLMVGLLEGGAAKEAELVTALRVVHAAHNARCAELEAQHEALLHAGIEVDK